MKFGVSENLRKRKVIDAEGDYIAIAGCDMILQSLIWPCSTHHFCVVQSSIQVSNTKEYKGVIQWHLYMDTNPNKGYRDVL